MRKGQIEILEKARENNFPENVIELLKSEVYTIKLLKEMYDFFSYHRQEVIEDAGVFFAVKEFFYEILDRRFYSYFFFQRCTVENILQLRLEYNQSLYTRQELRDISDLMNFAGCTLEDAKCIVAERKKFLQDGLQCDLSDGIECIYGKNSFSQISVSDKIKIEKYCVLNQIPLRCAEYSIKKYLMETNYPGLWEICLALKNKEDNNTSYTKEYLWEKEKVEWLKKMLEGLGEKPLQAEVSGSPYKLTSSVSLTGISIKCVTYSKYKFDVKKDGSTFTGCEKICCCDEILFLFDGACYTKKVRKWRPATLKDFAVLYNRNETLAQILEIYMEKFIREDAYVWKDLKKDIKGKTVPPVLVNTMRRCRNKKEMMCSCYKHAGFYNWNRKDLFTGYLAMKALSYIETSDAARLLDYANKLQRPGWYTNEHMAGVLITDFLVSMMMQKITEDTYWKDEKGETVSKEEVERLIKDYIIMSRQMKKKISIRFCSAKKIKDAHDALCLEYRSKHTPKIEIPKKSRFSDLRKILPKEPFEWIMSRRRIILEGEEMHHCVASYVERINRDTSAIYSFIYPENQKRYTIEFRANARGYYIAQIQGKYDRGCPKEVRDYVEGWLKKGEEALKKCCL